MFRTITVALGLAVAASALAAEEFVVIANDLFVDTATTAKTETVSTVSVGTTNITSEADLPENVRAAIANARGELPPYFAVNPFN
jgi:hypothetical protein